MVYENKKKQYVNKVFHLILFKVFVILNFGKIDLTFYNHC